MKSQSRDFGSLSVAKVTVDTEVEVLGLGLEQSAQKSFDSSVDESIVVLGNSSMDASQPGTSSPLVKNGQKITVENSSEMERKLEELMRENSELKASLEKNHTAMDEHLSALVNRQEELAKVYGAHRQKFAETKNRLEVVEAENDDLKARIEAAEKENADQSTQTEKTDDDPKPASSLAAVDNALSTELKAMAEKCEHQSQEIAHAHKIIASLKDQLASLYLNTFNPIKPEDLQSTVQIQEGPHEQQFLDSFTHYQVKLSELGYCYAAQTSRYTNIQDCLHRCSEILLKTENPSPRWGSRESLRSEIFEDLQECRSTLVEEELKTIAEREEMIRAQSEYQKIFMDYNKMILEFLNLRSQNDRLNGELQSAVALRDERHNKAEAAAKEKERLVEEQRRSVAKDRQDLLAQQTELQRSAEANANDLRKNQSLLEEKRKALEKDREVLEKDREALEKNRAVVQKDREALEKNRAVVQKDREALEKNRAVVQKDREALEKDRGVLEKDRDVLEKARTNFSAEKQRVAPANQTSDRALSEWEKSLNEKEQKLMQQQATFLRSIQNPPSSYSYSQNLSVPSFTNSDMFKYNNYIAGRCAHCGNYH